MEGKYIKFPENGYLTYFNPTEFEFLLKEYILRGETDCLDFKKENTRPKDLAPTISAMANTESGIIVIGIDEKAHKSGKNPWFGVKNIDQLKTSISNLQGDLIKPRVSLEFITLKIGSLLYLIVVVPKEKKGIYASGKYYVRMGSKNDYLRDGNEIKEWEEKKKRNKQFGFLVFQRLKIDLLSFQLEEKVPKLKDRAIISRIGRILLETLLRTSPEGANMYFGAMKVLMDEDNPERFSQCAHSLGELINYLVRNIDIPILVRKQ
ncbi:MAG: helix-turn-helix domain-containing protein [Candidatus Hermodarchaeota archaeon]